MLVSEKLEGTISSKGYKSYEQQLVSTWYVNNFSSLLYHKQAICILSTRNATNYLMISQYKASTNLITHLHSRFHMK